MNFAKKLNECIKNGHAIACPMKYIQILKYRYAKLRTFLTVKFILTKL